MITPRDFPEEFYQAEELPEITRTTDPSGGVLLDPLDLLTPTPWAVINTLANREDSRNKKNLIFADPVYKNREESEQKDIVLKLKQAKDAGFKIYILEDDSITEWEGGDVPKDYAANFKEITSEKIRDYMWKNYKIGSNSLCFLDYFTVNKLIKRQLNQLVVNEFVDDSKSYVPLKEFLDYLSQEKKIEDFFRALEIGEYGKDFFFNFLAAFNGKNLEHLEKILLSWSDVSAEDLGKLFLVAPNLKKLELFFCKKIAGAFENLEPNSLKHLEEINLSDTEVGAEDLEKLSLTAPNLKEINLSSCKNIAGAFKNLKPNSLQHLEEINLYKANVGAEDLEKLSLTAPNLKKIDLSSCENIAGAFENLKPNSLKHLEEINLDGSNVSAGDLETLFPAAPNLKKINLHSCKNISEDFPDSLENVIPRFLEEIQIGSADCDVACSLNVLSVKAPNLKKISFSSCKNAYGCLLNLQRNSLQCLEEINLTCINGGINLKNLFEGAPNLKKIIFFSLPDIAHSFQYLTSKSLQSLEEIDLSFTNVSAADLQQLRLAAPNAKIDMGDRWGSSNTASSSSLAERVHGTITTTDNPIDFSVDNRNKPPLVCTRYFSGIEPALYRLFTWKPDLDSNNLTKRYFVPADFTAVEDQANPLKITQPDLSKTHDEEKGVITVTNASGREIVLPSLSAAEKITRIQVIGANGSVVDNKTITLEYSETEQFYRIVLPKAGKYTINFNAAVPKEMPKPPEKLEGLVNRYNSFTIKENLQVPACQSLREYATFYQQNKAGRCELRALAAYAELLEASIPKENIRIIENDIHAYLEVKGDNNTWHKLDLGGYPANIVEEPMPIHAEKPRIARINADKEAGANVLNTEVLNTDFLSQHALYLIPDATALKNQYAEFVKEHDSAHIFVAHKINQLSLTAHGLDRDGKFLKEYTDLKRWVTEHSTEAGVIVVDMRFLKDEEISQLNDLLDRKIEGQTLADNIKIVLIDTPERNTYGPDFRRRVKPGIVVSSAKEPLLLSAPQQSNDNNNNNIPQCIEIDLFNSPFYERILLGSWQLKKDNQTAQDSGLSLAWGKGLLLEAIEKAKGAPLEIVFKNPPLHNPEFNTFLAELQTLRRLLWADQSVSVPENIKFYETKGYDWSLLCEKVKIEQLSEASSDIFCLSNANIWSFISDPAQFFSKTTEALVPGDCYLTQAQKKQQPLRVFCSPDLSQSTLAQFLAAAKTRDVPVSFVMPDVNHIPESSALCSLPIKPALSGLPVLTVSNVDWELHNDVYARAQKLQKIGATCFNLSSLSAADLGHFPLFSEEDKNKLLTTSRLIFKAPTSAILEKLKKGETVVLTGTIPARLTAALAALSRGDIDGERFKGKLMIVATPKEQLLVQAITGIQKPVLDIQSSGQDLATTEREELKEKLKAKHQPLQKNNLHSDEERAEEIDNRRLHDVQEALKLSPWVMIEGKTGIGKSHFLQKVLPNEFQVCYSIEEWLNKKPEENKDIVLVMDEANFNSQLENLGDNFLERFSNLKSNPPGFLWQGQYYELSPHHKISFAFNPSTYGQGRKSGGLLDEHNVPVSFDILPDFYLRARVIDPLLTQMLSDKALNKSPLSGPIIDMYRWLANHSTDEVLITPREIKAMIHLISAKVNASQNRDPETLGRIATEFAYDIGRQTISDDRALLLEFDSAFKEPQRVISQRLVLEPACRQKAYNFIQDMLAANSASSSVNNGDIGLGGILLEGPSGIGKTYFVEQIEQEYNKTGKTAYRISASTPYSEKVRLLKEAFEAGAMVIAEEFNTSLWPNKLLNNYLMGLDEKGNPSKKPGFILIGTQNPPSFVGRTETDPAIRRRVVKLVLDWLLVVKHNAQMDSSQAVSILPGYNTLTQTSTGSASSSNTPLKPF